MRHSACCVAGAWTGHCDTDNQTIGNRCYCRCACATATREADVWCGRIAAIGIRDDDAIDAFQAAGERGDAFRCSGSVKDVLTKVVSPRDHSPLLSPTTNGDSEQGDGDQKHFNYRKDC